MEEDDIIRAVKENDIECAYRSDEDYYMYDDFNKVLNGIADIQTPFADHIRGSIYCAMNRTGDPELLHKAIYWLDKSSNAGMLKSTIILYFMHMDYVEGYKTLNGTEKYISRLAATPESVVETIEIVKSIRCEQQLHEIISYLFIYAHKIQHKVIEEQQKNKHAQTTINELTSEITRLKFTPGMEGYQEAADHFDDLAGSENSKK